MQRPIAATLNRSQQLAGDTLSARITGRPRAWSTMCSARPARGASPAFRSAASSAPAEPSTRPPGRLLAHPLDLDLIRDGWDDLMRCAASLNGTVTASLLVGRPQAAGAKLPLTRALQEYGRLIKTRFPLGYLADDTERGAISRQHNNMAESLHALHERLFHGHHGTRAPAHARAPIDPGALPAPRHQRRHLCNWAASRRHSRRRSLDRQAAGSPDD